MSDFVNYYKHWAEGLETGDRVKATIRHESDGSKNRHNVDIIVVNVDPSYSIILGYDAETKSDLQIPFNELKQP